MSDSKRVLFHSGVTLFTIITAVGIISQTTLPHLFDPLLLLLVLLVIHAWFVDSNSGLVVPVIVAAVAFYFQVHTKSEGVRMAWSDVLVGITGMSIWAFFHKLRHTRELDRIRTIDREQKGKITHLEETVYKLKSEVRARDEFLSIASHELRTPLTSVLLKISMTLHNIRNVSLANFSVENLLKSLTSVEQQTQRLTRMINDLLNVSLITTGKLELEREEFDLSLLVKDIVDRFAEKLQQENYTVTFRSDSGVIGYWDRIRIEQAISNLLSNAIKYGNKKPITVTVTKKRNMAEIRVKDHGIGIPEEKRERIFARFERAVSSKDFQGLGVGLYLTRQIILAHQGKISVESGNGDGSTFIISLPFTKPFVPQLPEPETNRLPEAIPLVNHQRIK